MKYDPEIHHRRSIRLQGYDYSRAGAYFVTICTQNRECLLGNIGDGEMRLNEAGRIVADSWIWLATQYDHVELDEWVIMPNHIHGIIVIADDDRGGPVVGGTHRSTHDGWGGSRTAPTGTGKRKPIGRLVGAYKTVSTKRINVLRATPGAKLWQRNYWEHIIRNEPELNRIREYIQNNPAQWQSDRLRIPSKLYGRRTPSGMYGRFANRPNCPNRPNSNEISEPIPITPRRPGWYEFQIWAI